MLVGIPGDFRLGPMLMDIREQAPEQALSLANWAEVNYPIEHAQTVYTHLFEIIIISDKQNMWEYLAGRPFNSAYRTTATTFQTKGVKGSQYVCCAGMRNGGKKSASFFKYLHDEYLGITRIFLNMREHNIRKRTVLFETHFLRTFSSSQSIF